MKRDDARNVVRECLESGYEPGKFDRLVANLLTGEYNFFEKFVWESYVRHAFKDFVSSYVIRGAYEDPEWKRIAILEVKLKNSSNLFNARTMQRNFVADFLKNGSLGRQDWALVAYTVPGSEDWRFSFVKMEYSLDVVDGKIKTTEEITPAKRWSFLVGRHEKSHTAQSRLCSLVEEESHPATFKEIEQAFDVEKVTNEFFEKYKELFFRLKEEMERLVVADPNLAANFDSIGLLDKSLEDGKSLGVANLAKKTLGQIAFLYFLQKKGWFGVAPDKQWWEGPKNFLRELFKRREKYGSNFFNDILEPLFYEALATDRGEASFYTRLNNCRIPFLNGGLFEPMKGYDWERTSLVISDDLFSNENKTKEGDIWDGILDVFDRYNFTVSEDEPLEKEVAVDPEMLGKIFENLLEVNDRKSKGAFYTPRPIVHYMCQESLIEYILSKVPDVPREDLEMLMRESEGIIENDRITKEKILEKRSKGFDYVGEYKFKTPESIIANASRIDQALSQVRIVDPAVGSGAFPLGLINEIVKARQIVWVHLEKEASSYDLKLHAIQHSIYGVDLDPGAVEICQLRLWLSLVVDEKEPHPLPNLDYRIMQGNSLIEEYDGIRLYDAKLLEKFDGRLRGEQITFDSYSGNFSESERLYQKLQSSLERFIQTSARTEKKDLKKTIDALKWSLIETTLREQGKHEKIEEIQRLRNANVTPFFLWKLEFAEVFQENGGFDICIGNPPYVQIQKFARTQIQTDLEKAKYETFAKTGDLYCLFYERGLEMTRKSTGILSFITSNKWMRAGYGERLRAYFVKHNPLKLLDLGGNVFESATVDSNILLIQNAANTGKTLACTISNHTEDLSLQMKEATSTNFTDASSWFIGSGAEIALKEKVERVGKSLKEWEIKMNFWVKTGFNEAFIIDEKIRNKLIAEEFQSAEIIKKVCGWKSIDRYNFQFKEQYIVHTGYDLDIFVKYPRIYEHFLQHEAKLKLRGDKGKNWWNLRACIYYEEFEKEKIVWREITSEQSFCLVPAGVYVYAPATFLVAKDHLKYILGFLNSKLAMWMFSSVAHTLWDTWLEWKKAKIETLSLVPVTSSNQHIVTQIESLVDRIMSEKQYNPKADTSALEREIDRLVYGLYELTEEEIAIVEGKSEK